MTFAGAAARLGVRNWDIGKPGIFSTGTCACFDHLARRVGIEGLRYLPSVLGSLNGISSRGLPRLAILSGILRFAASP